MRRSYQSVRSCRQILSSDDAESSLMLFFDDSLSEEELRLEVEIDGTHLHIGCVGNAFKG